MSDEYLCFKPIESFVQTNDPIGQTFTALKKNGYVMVDYGLQTRSWAEAQARDLEIDFVEMEL